MQTVSHISKVASLLIKISISQGTTTNLYNNFQQTSDSAASVCLCGKLQSKMWQGLLQLRFLLWQCNAYDLAICGRSLAREMRVTKAAVVQQRVALAARCSRSRCTAATSAEDAPRRLEDINQVLNVVSI